MKINKNATVQPIFRNCKKTMHAFTDRKLRNFTCLNVIIEIRRICEILPELTSASSAFLNATTCLSKYVLNYV